MAFDASGPAAQCQNAAAASEHAQETVVDRGNIQVERVLQRCAAEVAGT
jgi:hypothetical protein